MTNPTPSASGPEKSPRRELLEEAADLIDGDRNVSYGSPTQNFQNIAELWNTRFAHMLKDGEKFTAADVADSMILVKVARNIANQKRDNWADIAGYAGCGYEASLDDEPAPKVETPKSSGMGGSISPPGVNPWTLLSDQVKKNVEPQTFNVFFDVAKDVVGKQVVDGIVAEMTRLNKGGKLSELKILALKADNQACGLYRVELPAQYAEQAGVVTELAEDLPVDATIDVNGEITIHSVNTDADVIIFQRPLLSSFVPAIRQAQKQGIACVVELDDDLASVDRDNVAYYAVNPAYNKVSNWKHLAKAANLADWVTASTPEIARRFASHGRVSIIRNSLPSSIFSIEKTFDIDPRIGWAGSLATHPHDLEVVGSHIGTLLTTTNARFSLIGDEAGVKEQLGIKAEHKMNILPWTTLETYHQALADNIDIGIVPLDLTPFNKSKSYLKGLEMAGVGIPFVASPTDEYRYLAELGAGIIAKKRADWQKCLKPLIVDRDRLLEESARARDAVRMLTYDNSIEAWKTAWMSALDERSHSRAL